MHFKSHLWLIVIFAQSAGTGETWELNVQPLGCLFNILLWLTQTKIYTQNMKGPYYWPFLRESKGGFGGGRTGRVTPLKFVQIWFFYYNIYTAGLRHTNCIWNIYRTPFAPPLTSNPGSAPGIYQRPVDSPHKGPIMQKVFTSHDIMECRNPALSNQWWWNLKGIISQNVTGWNSHSLNFELFWFWREIQFICNVFYKQLFALFFVLQKLYYLLARCYMLDGVITIMGTWWNIVINAMA